MRNFTVAVSMLDLLVLVSVWPATFTLGASNSCSVKADVKRSVGLLWTVFKDLIFLLRLTAQLLQTFYFSVKGCAQGGLCGFLYLISGRQRCFLLLSVAPDALVSSQ